MLVLFGLGFYGFATAVSDLGLLLAILVSRLAHAELLISLFFMCYDAGSSFASGGRATSEKWRRFIVILLYYPSINLSVLNRLHPGPGMMIGHRALRIWTAATARPHRALAAMHSA